MSEEANVKYAKAKSINDVNNVSAQQVNNVRNVTVKNINNVTSVSAYSDKSHIYEQQALQHSNTAKQWAEKSEQSAEESKESADKAEFALNQILNNEDLKKVSANGENINKVANDIENVNFVGENIEDITELVTSLENLGDTININIVASNINDVNTVANSIEDVNSVVDNVGNIEITAQNIESINYVANNIEDIQTVEANKNIVLSQVAVAVEKANIAIEKSNNAKVWAEGTDEEVQALGGVHSSKGWAELLAEGMGGKWGTIIGNITEQYDLMEQLDSKANTSYVEELVEGFEEALDNKVSSDGLNEIYSILNEFNEALEYTQDTKQDKLTAGNNIKIENNVISAIDSGSGFNLFDTKISDHILEGDELKGWALQGTYVYKEAVAGVRDGYPDFYNKVLEHYGNATETKKGYLSSNVNTVGNLVNRQGVLSGFNVSNYATLPQPFNPNAETWEMQFKFNLTDLSKENHLFDTTVQYDGMVLRISTEGKLQTYISSNGTSWNIASSQTGTYVFETNKDYWVKAKFNGSQYIFSYSTNGINFIDDITVASTATLYSGATGYVLGIKRDFTNPLTGELDLNESYININGERWWQGTNKYEYKQAPNGLKFYDITDKSTIDEVFNNTGLAWFYGVDIENERVFLPRNVWFEQLTSDTSQVGDSVEAGLPNITGNTPTLFGGVEDSYPTTGSFRATRSSNRNYSTTSGSDNGWVHIDFNASRSSEVYGNSDTVQPNAIKKLLYICVGNTNVESAITDIVEVTTTENDTMPLFTGMYFDFKPNNISWLKAGEQANSGDVYTTAYNELVNCLNGVNKYNLKVIDIADMVSGVDYSEYWKVNQDEMTFTTPTAISNKALSGAIAGNGMALGLYYKTSEGLFNNAGLLNRMADTSRLAASPDAYGVNVGQIVNTSVYVSTDDTAIGITTDPTKSGIIAEQSTSELYFKVANAVQNLELLNVGEVMESLSNKCDVDLANCTKPYVIEVSDKSLMPSWYRVYSDGWCEQGGEFIDTGSVAFLKEYVSTDYTININYLENTSTSNITVTHLAPRRTTTGFTVASSSYKKSWQASGYIL